MFVFNRVTKKLLWVFLNQVFRTTFESLLEDKNCWCSSSVDDCNDDDEDFYVINSAERCKKVMLVPPTVIY